MVAIPDYLTGTPEIEGMRPGVFCMAKIQESAVWKMFGKILLAVKPSLIASIVVFLVSWRKLSESKPYEIVYPYPPSPVPAREEFEAIAAAAEAGDSDSQLYPGHFYANGDGIDQDYARAAAWYRKAAEQGNSRAGITWDFCMKAALGSAWIMPRPSNGTTRR
jgi:hypothetical protein